MKTGPKWFRSRRNEVLICVFMGVLVPLFGFWFVMFVVRHLFPEIRDEVPEKLSRRPNFLRRELHESSQIS